VYVPVPVTEERRVLDIKGLSLLKLMVDDGPLNHIARAKTLGEAWITLKAVFDKEGFSSLVILIKSFIALPCKKGKVNEYLNDICNVVNHLEAKDVLLPIPFLLSWVLERLDKSYNDFKTSIYSEFRTNQKAYTLESLSAAILDEFRR
jgi:LTR polyprotein gag-polypeptide-like protein